MKMSIATVSTTITTSIFTKIAITTVASVTV